MQKTSRNIYMYRSRVISINCRNSGKKKKGRQAVSGPSSLHYARKETRAHTWYIYNQPRPSRKSPPLRKSRPMDAKLSGTAGCSCEPMAKLWLSHNNARATDNHRHIQFHLHAAEKVTADIFIYFTRIPPPPPPLTAPGTPLIS